jgi:hypothetical protein
MLIIIVGLTKYRYKGTLQDLTVDNIVDFIFDFQDGLIDPYIRGGD